MHSLNLLFLLQIGFNLDHGILGRQIAWLQLRVIERPVRGDVAGHVFRRGGVDEQFLAADHEVVGAQVGADDDVAAADEGAGGGEVVGGAGALMDGDAWVGGGEGGGEFGWVAAEAEEMGLGI